MGCFFFDTCTFSASCFDERVMKEEAVRKQREKEKMFKRKKNFSRFEKQRGWIKISPPKSRCPKLLRRSEFSTLIWDFLTNSAY